MKTLFDPVCYDAMIARLRSLRPGNPARWGHLTAPRMLVHLSDQMRHILGEIQITPGHGVLRWPFVKHAVMFWLPWPKGRVKSSPELFTTVPGSWDADLATLESLLVRFVGANSRTDWPDHPFFGHMTRDTWGRFIHRHFDWHLRQFGV